MCVCAERESLRKRRFSINHRPVQLAMDRVAAGRDGSLGIAVSLLKSFQDG